MKISSIHCRAGTGPESGPKWFIIIIFAVLFAVVANLAFLPESALAANLTVTTNADSTNAGSLRHAIEQSNLAPDSDTIIVPPNTYTLLSELGPLEITSHVTIIGANGASEGDAALTIIEASDSVDTANMRVFDINPFLNDTGYNVSLKALTIRHGNAGVGSSYGGAGIAADTGINTVTIYNCIVENNKSSYEGAGLYISGLAGGTFDMKNTFVHNNIADGPGGGIYIEGDLNVAISSSSIQNNRSLNSQGGGITIQPATAAMKTITIGSSTITGNSAVGTGGEGGGIYLGSPATISDTTISGNGSDAEGGGVYYANYGAGLLTLTNNTKIENNNALQHGNPKNLCIHIGGYVNTAPIITAPVSISVTEDVALPLTGISFSDVDSDSGSVTATLSVSSGALSASAGGGVTVVGGGTGTVTLTGSVSDINAFIATGNIAYATVANSVVDVTLTIGINDGGNTGSGGPLTDSTIVTLTVQAVNDAPTAKSPVQTQSMIGTGTASFTASNIAEDVDSGDTLTITSIVTSSDSEIATAVFTSETIIVTGVSTGSTFVEVRVSDGTTTVDVTVPIAVTDVPTIYSVGIGSPTGGSIVASPTSAPSGASIILTITPDTDMQLKAGTLTYHDGTTDHVISGTSFSMPAANVTVTAEFEAIPATPITAPVLQNATTDNSGTQILLTFNKAMNNPAGSAGAFIFSVSRNGALLAESVTGITVGGSNSTQFILSLAQSLLADDLVQISYTPGTISSADGGVLGVVINQSVMNKAPRPMVVVADTPITVIAGQQNLSITSETVSSAGSTPVIVNVPSGVTNTTLNVVSLLQPASSGTVTSSPLPALTITATVDLNSNGSTPVNVQVKIPQGTTVSAPDGWNGTLQLPTVAATNSVTVTPSSGSTATVNSVIEVGYGDVPLTFSRAVRLLIPGQTGKKVGYVRSGMFYPISTRLTVDEQTTVDNTLLAGQDGYLNAGSDLVIWTKHFTRFVTYTETNNNTGRGNSGGSGSTPNSTTVIGKVLDQGTGQAIKEIAAQVSTETNGNKTVTLKAIEVMVFKQPNGATSPIGDLSKLGFTAAANTNSNGTLFADGSIQVKNLAKGTESQFAVTHDLGNGETITIGWLDINVGSQGEIGLTCTLVDPYGVITDPTTGKSISGVKVSLYYANTNRNKAAGKIPETLVPLPKLDGFQPNNNINPQVSDASGAYGFMVFPTADYYFVATKEGYEAYQSPTISVEQELVKWDFKMNQTITGVKRLAGLTRVDTALEIAKSNYTSKLSSVVLATAENYPDALAGSVLAYKLNAPILLVGRTETDQEKILAYLKSNIETTGTVYILGGTAVVSAKMEAKVAAAGFNQITRLGGIDRYETAIKIADQLGIKTGTPIVLVYGENYPDALSISSIAAEMQSPILLVQKDVLSDAVKQKISEIKPMKVYIIGGEGVISANVERQVAHITSLDKTNIVRIAGADRYATSLAVAQYFNLSGQSVCIATGNNFPDALAGSVYAANFNAPIILADESLSDQVMNYLKARTMTGATLFGGEAVVSQKIKQQIKQLIENKY